MAWGFTSYGPAGDWVFKSIPALCQEAAVVMSCGGAFMVYDQPERSGPLVSWHMDDIAQVAAFVKARQAYAQGTHSVPQVAILHSHMHFHELDRPLFGLGEAISPVMGALQALLDIGLHADLLQDEQLLARVRQYPMVVIPEQLNLSEALMKALNDYVQDGGRLFVAGFKGTEAFDSILGVKEADKDGMRPDGGTLFLQHGMRTTAAPGRMRQVSLLTAEAADRTSAGGIVSGYETRSGMQADECGFVAATVRRIGDGYAAGV